MIELIKNPVDWGFLNPFVGYVVEIDTPQCHCLDNLQSEFNRLFPNYRLIEWKQKDDARYFLVYELNTPKLRPEAEIVEKLHTLEKELVELEKDPDHFKRFCGRMQYSEQIQTLKWALSMAKMNPGVK